MQASSSRSTRLKRTNLVDEVIGAIQDWLKNGTFRIGDKLPSETELAQRFGVSRPTIREGLRVLSHLGLVESRSGTGTFIIRTEVEQGSRYRELSGTDLATVIEYRFVIESYAARLAAERRSDAQMKAIREAWSKACDAVANRNLPLFVARDMEFHTAIIEASGNWLLVDAYRRSRNLVEQSIGTVLDLGPFETMAHVHADLLQAIEKRAPEKAEAAVKENFDEVAIRMRYVEA